MCICQERKPGCLDIVNTLASNVTVNQSFEFWYCRFQLILLFWFPLWQTRFTILELLSHLQTTCIITPNISILSRRWADDRLTEAGVDLWTFHVDICKHFCCCLCLCSCRSQSLQHWHSSFISKLLMEIVCWLFPKLMQPIYNQTVLSLFVIC